MPPHPLLTLAVLTLAAASGCRDRTPQPSPGPTPAASFREARWDLRQLQRDDGQWVMATKSYDNVRFSGLSQITSKNAAQLKLQWTFSTGTTRGNEAAPLVAGDTMYVVTPFPNVLYALDLTQPGAPAKWAFKPEPDPASQGVACCDAVNRGAAFAGGRVFFNTLDGYTVAVDAASGKQAWRTRVGDFHLGETITMAPMVARGKVYVGNSGGELGVRGWLAALDAGDGRIAWRAYSTGPDADVLIGPRFKPFYPSDRGEDLGVTTWPPGQWKIGGGTAWGFLAHDPELNLIYYGTANPGPWNPDQRPGDNKWTCGLFARDADTGEAIWFYQFSPHDLYDHDGVNENLLVDLRVDGAPRKALIHPDRNGFVYVMDRTTGEVLSATPFGHVNVSTGVDLKTGRPRMVAEKEPHVGRTVRDICPAPPGAKDWQPSAFSPRTGLLYIPRQHLCHDEEAVEANYIAGTPYVGANVKMYAGPGGHRGELVAWDPLAGRARWRLYEKFPVWSGALVTAGDVVFYGTMDGWFKAVSAETGALLWQLRTASGIVGQPVTYLGPDGKQYVAVLSGVGGWAGAIVAAELDPRDPTAALGFVNAMSDLPQATTRGGVLSVFALP